MSLNLLICGMRVRIHTKDKALHESIERYYRPALQRCSSIGAKAQIDKGEIDLEIDILENSLQFIQGLATETPADQSLFSQLESALVQTILGSAGIHPVLHAGCVYHRGRIIVFIAPSGGGKSSMTRAAVRAGASYITDDVLVIKSGTLYGFARAIRQEVVSPQLDPIPHYLADCHLEVLRVVQRSPPIAVPIWWQGGQVIHALPINGQEVIVVNIERGPQLIRPFSAIERMIALHESAIVSSAEYDGSLGAGRGFSLAWEDPAEAFAALDSIISDPKGTPESPKSSYLASVV